MALKKKIIKEYEKWLSKLEEYNGKKFFTSASMFIFSSSLDALVTKLNIEKGIGIEANSIQNFFYSSLGSLGFYAEKILVPALIVYELYRKSKKENRNIVEPLNLGSMLYGFFSFLGLLNLF
ncbi:hypothetical protein B6U82_01725 [Candidatus Pacearchaeota archaeon ex4484_31]|nr:MAG: hypothetical protein B6U82_01725 [Candidatus Pacearchaeota archaeon ex4484_31]